MQCTTFVAFLRETLNASAPVGITLFPVLMKCSLEKHLIVLLGRFLHTIIFSVRVVGNQT